VIAANPKPAPTSRPVTGFLEFPQGSGDEAVERESESAVGRRNSGTKAEVIPRVAIALCHSSAVEESLTIKTDDKRCRGFARYDKSGEADSRCCRMKLRNAGAYCPR